MKTMAITVKMLGRLCMANNEETFRPHYFYVLWCKDHSLYAGYTTDLERREKQHNDGTAAKYTRPRTRRPLQMIYAETYRTQTEAMRAEYAFKQLTRAQKERYLQENEVVFPLKKSTECIKKDKVTDIEDTTEL